MNKNPQIERRKLAVIRQNLLELQAYATCTKDPVAPERRQAYLVRIREQLARLDDIERQDAFFSRLTEDQQQQEKGPLVVGREFEVSQLDRDLGFYRKLVAQLESYFRQLTGEESSFLGRFVGIMKLAELKKVFTHWQHQTKEHREASAGLERAATKLATACRWQSARWLMQKAKSETSGAAEVLASINRGVDGLNRKISGGIAVVRVEEDRIRKITRWETAEKARLAKIDAAEDIDNPGMDKILEAANAMSSVPHGAFQANRSYLWQARRSLQAQEVNQSLPEGLPLLPPSMMEGGQW